VRQGRMDEMVVHVEATVGEASDAARKANAAVLRDLVKDIVGVTVRVDVGAPETIARSQGKAQRIVDNRPKS